MNRFRLMIVDDDPDIRFVIASLLGNEFETAEAFNGLDALEKLDRYQPDMIVLDINMPVMNGIACCRAIRRSEEELEIPILFVTATATDTLAEDVLNVGGTDFLLKPFEAADLIRIVKKHLDQFPAPREKRFSIAELEAIDNTPLGAADGKGLNAPAPREASHDQETVSDATTGKRIRRVFGRKRGDGPPSGPMRAPSVHEETVEPDRPPHAPRTPAPAPAGPSPSDVLARRRLAGMGRGEARHGAKPRVLVLIDTDEQLRTCHAALKGLAEFLPLEDPVEAIELIARFQPDIVVVGTQGRTYSGLQLAALLRSTPRLDHTEVLFLRPLKIDPRTVEKARRLSGGNPMVPVKFAAGDLREAVEGVLRKPGFRIREKRLAYGVYVKEVIRAADEERARDNKLKEKEALEERMHSFSGYMARQLRDEHVDFKVRDAPEAGLGGGAHKVP